MSGKYVRRTLLLLALVAIAALLPGAGQSRPPESDGSTYTWTGAATLTVDVKPWGGGSVATPTSSTARWPASGRSSRAVK